MLVLVLLSSLSVHLVVLCKPLITWLSCDDGLFDVISGGSLLIASISGQLYESCKFFVN
jgi:hypothetical protein